VPNPALPQNQINALPLQSPEASTEPAEVQVFGTALTKFWGPTVIGVSALAASNADPLPAGSPFFSAINTLTDWVIPTMFVNTIGVGRFAAVLRRTRVPASGAGGALTGLTFWVQYRFVKGEIPPVTRAAAQETVIGKTKVNNVAIAWPAMVAEAIPQTLVVAWSHSTNTIPGPLAVGSDVRLLMDWGAAGSLPTASDLWSLQLWASSL